MTDLPPDPTPDLRRRFIAALAAAAARIPVAYLDPTPGRLLWIGWTDDKGGPRAAGYWVSYGLGTDPDLLPYAWRTFLSVVYLPHVPDDQVRPADRPEDTALDLGYFHGPTARDPELLAELALAAALTHRRRVLRLPEVDAVPVRPGPGPTP